MEEASLRANQIEDYNIIATGQEVRLCWKLECLPKSKTRQIMMQSWRATETEELLICFELVSPTKVVNRRLRSCVPPCCIYFFLCYNHCIMFQHQSRIYSCASSDSPQIRPYMSKLILSCMSEFNHNICSIYPKWCMCMHSLEGLPTSACEIPSSYLST